MHPVPGRLREGGQVDERGALGPGTVGGSMRGHGGQFDLWAGAGGAEPDPHDDQAFPRGDLIDPGGSDRSQERAAPGSAVSTRRADEIAMRDLITLTAIQPPTCFLHMGSTAPG